MAEILQFPAPNPFEGDPVVERIASNFVAHSAHYSHPHWFQALTPEHVDGRKALTALKLLGELLHCPMPKEVEESLAAAAEGSESEALLVCTSEIAVAALQEARRLFEAEQRDPASIGRPSDCLLAIRDAIAAKVQTVN